MIAPDALPLRPPRPPQWLTPGFDTPVRALMTTRAGPAPSSPPPYDAFNLGLHVGDDPQQVLAHRRALASIVGAVPVWLDQVHGNHVVRATAAMAQTASADLLALQADGAVTTEEGVACVVMVADCLPVLLAAPEGRGVAALHAGWRGLAGAGAMAGRGILDTGLSALCEATGAAPADVQAWLGPCIGPRAFEVGADVLAGFGVDPAQPSPYFVRLRTEPRGIAVADKWLADLPGLARQRLTRHGVRRIEAGPWCTVSDTSRFFSFRRDGITGRQAACIWIDRQR